MTTPSSKNTKYLLHKDASVITGKEWTLPGGIMCNNNNANNHNIKAIIMYSYIGVSVARKLLGSAHFAHVDNVHVTVGLHVLVNGMPHPPHIGSLWVICRHVLDSSPRGGALELLG